MKKNMISILLIVIATSLSFAQTSLIGTDIGYGKSVDYSNRSVDATYFLTQSLSQSVGGTTVIGCNSSNITRENSYMRVFDLVGDFTINEDINVVSIDFGIVDAIGAGGSQPATVNIYSLSGPFLFANLTLIATQSISVPDQSLTLLNVPISASIPAGSVLVLEIYIPDGDADGNTFWMGANGLGETNPSYIAAATCGLSEPATLASITFPEVQWVMNIHAEPTQPVPLSNWPIYLGILLIGAFAVVRYRRKLA